VWEQRNGRNGRILDGLLERQAEQETTVKLSVAARKRLAQVVVKAIETALEEIPEETARLAGLESAVETALRQVGAAALTTVLGVCLS
jgi:hypothetical protein